VKPIILCIDRDDDIGRGVGTKGPIVGRELNMEVAQKLALVDPTDTDVNALYGALKLADELDTEIVTLTGDREVGLVSDRKVAEQLEKIIGELNPSSVILVTDGLDDQQVIPIIQSRVKIDSVQTVVVRQSKELEKAYFKLIHFLKEVSADPNLARLIFGVPGIVLMLLAVGGIQALTWIMGVVSVYLIIKGAGWEEEFFSKTSDFFKSLSAERISTLIYFIAFVAFVLGAGYAYGDLQRISLDFTDFNTALNTIGLFILNTSSVNFMAFALIVVLAARIIDDWSVKRFIQVRRYMIVAAFIVLVKFVLDAGANYMINEDFGFGSFILHGTVGVLSLAAWIKLVDLIFKPEIAVIDRITRETENKEVFDADGKRLGKAGKAVVENLELREIRVGRKTIARKDIRSIDKVIVVNARQA